MFDERPVLNKALKIRIFVCKINFPRHVSISLWYFPLLSPTSNHSVSVNIHID